MGVGFGLVFSAMSGLIVNAVPPAQTGVATDQPGDLDDIQRLAGADDLHELARFPDPLAPATAALRATNRPWISSYNENMRAGSSSSPANTATPATIAMLSAIDLMIMTGQHETVACGDAGRDLPGLSGWKFSVPIRGAAMDACGYRL